MSNGRKDLRIAIGWSRHPKTRRLKKKVGPQGPLSLVALWEFAAIQCPEDGVLRGMSPEEIEEAAEWDGETGAFHAAIVEIRWMEPDGVSLHDWKEEQPYISGYSAYIEECRTLGAIGAAKRWRKKTKGGKDRPPIRPPIENAEKWGPYSPPNSTVRPTNQPPDPEESGRGLGLASQGAASPAGGRGAKDIPKPACRGDLCTDPLCCEAGLRNSRRSASG